MFKVAIIGLVIALAGVARAETPIPEAEADDLMRQALELRRQGQNAKALELLQRAQTLAPSAKALAQLGSAEFVSAAMGRRRDTPATGSLDDRLTVDQDPEKSRDAGKDAGRCTAPHRTGATARDIRRSDLD